MSHIAAICHIVVNMLYIVATCLIAVDKSHIVAMCHIAVDMSNRGKICPYKNEKIILGKRRPISDSHSKRRVC